jgi:NYN domain
VDRCALFVDAGYVLADGAMAVHGTRHRGSVAWDYAGLLRLLCDLARDGTGVPLLRCYWYEAAVEGRRTPDHDALADLPGLKLRLGRMRPGRREGVDTEVHRDLSTLARNRAISDAVIVSAEEDLAQVVGDVQDLGVRVTLVHITVDGNWTISRLLRQECDAIIEVGATHLRPHVTLIAVAQTAHYHDQYPPGQSAGKPLANGHGPSTGHGSYHALPVGHHQGPPAIYTSPVAAPEQEHATGGQGPQDVPGPPASGGQAAPGVEMPAQPASASTGAASEAAASQPAGPGQPPASPQTADGQLQTGQSAAVHASAGGPVSPGEHGVPPGHALAGASGGSGAVGGLGVSPGEQSVPPGQHSQIPHGQVPADQHVPAATQHDEPAQQITAHAAQQVPGIYRQSRELAAPSQGAGQAQPQLYAAPTPALAAPVAAAPPLSAPTPTLASPGGSGAVGGLGVSPGEHGVPPGQHGATLPAPTPAGGAQPVSTLPAAPPEPAQAAPPSTHDTGWEHDHAHGHPGRTPFVPTSPDLPPRRAQLARSAPPSGPPAIASPQPAGAGQPSVLPAPYVPPAQGQYGGPQPGQPVAATATLADAVQAAHAEGLDFGDSVARDAPALWLEAVLARKPRMPSDLEARLLQGSSLPIDFLLHDEVRSALRRGFWDALERSRR